MKLTPCLLCGLVGNMKLTPWFNATQKPVRVGVYQRRHRHFGFYVFAYWDGEQWLLGAESPAAAAKETKLSVNQLTAFYWRGLEQPNLS